MRAKDIISEVNEAQNPDVASGDQPFVPLWESMETGTLDRAQFTVTDEDNERYTVTFQQDDVTVRHEESGRPLYDNQKESLLDWVESKLSEVLG